MPPGQATTWCHCYGCDQNGGVDAEGKPKGTAIPTRFYKTHLLRAQRKDADRLAAAKAQAAFINDAGAQIFTAALLDSGPNLEALPSKLWTSRAEFQKDRALHIAPITETNISMEAVVEGVQRLMVASDDRPPRPDAVEPDVLDTFSRLSLADTMPPLVDPPDDEDDYAPPTHGSPLPYRRPGMSRKERSQYSANALAVLEAVRTELRACSQNLSSASTAQNIQTARTVISNSRHAIERVKRSTPDLDKLKAELVDKIHNIEGHLLVLDTVSPQRERKRSNRWTIHRVSGCIEMYFLTDSVI
jgi:hypothetical protein